MTKCRICGKALSDPVSIANETGPICRIANKNHNRNLQSLFQNRASFDWGIIQDKVIWIVDLDNGFKSVTNDISNVLRDIKNEIGTLSDFKIMYRDSLGIWDGVKADPENLSRVSFYSLNVKDQSKAISKILQE